jgi:RNA polymerase sigma-70 factor (ECF subfamily)
VTRVPTSTPTSLAAALSSLGGSTAEEPVHQRPALTLARGDDRLAELLHAHFRMVWRALRRLGVQPQSVDDAAQEVFIIVSRKLDQIEPAHERRFLYGVAIRVAANARRARAARRESAELEALEGAAATTPSPEALLDRKRARELLDQALEQLSDDLRTAFVLFELEGCSAPEVAELLDIPVGTATSRLRRAREAFHVAAGELRRRFTIGVER